MSTQLMIIQSFNFLYTAKLGQKIGGFKSIYV